MKATTKQNVEISSQGMLLRVLNNVVAIRIICQPMLHLLGSLRASSVLYAVIKDNIRARGVECDIAV